MASTYEPHANIPTNCINVQRQTIKGTFYVQMTILSTSNSMLQLCAIFVLFSFHTFFTQSKHIYNPLKANYVSTNALSTTILCYNCGTFLLFSYFLHPICLVCQLQFYVTTVVLFCSFLISYILYAWLTCTTYTGNYNTLWHACLTQQSCIYTNTNCTTSGCRLVCIYISLLDKYDYQARHFRFHLLYKSCTI